MEKDENIEPIKLTLTLPKIQDIESVAICSVQFLCKAHGISDDISDQASILLSEAVINALEHVKKGREELFIELNLTSEELSMLIQDYGQGFDPTKVSNPDILEKMKSEYKRGWGLSLMKKMSDHFDIISNSSGTRIVMKLNI